MYRTYIKAMSKRTTLTIMLYNTALLFSAYTPRWGAVYPLFLHKQTHTASPFIKKHLDEDVKDIPYYWQCSIANCIRYDLSCPQVNLFSPQLILK
jgi:hypothetical protein